MRKLEGLAGAITILIASLLGGAAVAVLAPTPGPTTVIITPPPTTPLHTTPVPVTNPVVAPEPISD